MHKHILLIPSWYKTPQNPILGTFFEEQARMYQKRGHKVGILFPHHDLRFRGRTRFNGEKTPNGIVDNGLPTYYSFTESYVPKTSEPTFIDEYICTRSAYKQYKTYVRLYGKPDIIHAHSVIWAGVVAHYLSHKEKIPYFLTKHFTEWILSEEYANSKAYHKLLYKVVGGSKKTFVVSNFYKEELLTHYDFEDAKLDVVHNIVNPLFFNNKKPIKLDACIRLIVIAYLTPRKNILTIIKAIQLLNKNNKEAELIIVGNGPTERILKNYSNKHNLSAIVHFKGLLDRPDIEKELRNSHILVSASTYETFGVSIIEGLAAGRPVIVYDAGGPRDIVTVANGILVNENTPNAFAKTIKWMINNYSQYNQEEIADDCVKRFGEEVIYNKLMNYYGHKG